MRINILNYYIKEIINFNNYYHFFGNFLSHIYIFFLIFKYEIDLSILHEPLYGMVAFALSPIKKNT